MPSDATKPRVVIADDHPVFRDGLRRLLQSGGLDVVGEAANGEDALAVVRNQDPDILVLDVAMPRASGFDVLRELKVSGGPKTIVLTAGTSRDDAIRIVRLGARGLVLKEAAAETILKAIHCVLFGELWFDRQTMAESLLEALEKPQRKFGLTPREMEIVHELLTGAANKEIGAKFGISEETVKRHLSNIFDKVGVSTRLELSLFALHHKLAED